MKAHVDRVDTLEAVERYGTLIRLVRRVRVVEIIATNYKVLTKALDALDLDNEILPAAGDIVGTGENPYANLILTERKISLIPGDTTTVDVDLTYEHMLNDGQPLDQPPTGFILATVSATVNETESNIDADGKPITLAHKFPSTDKDYPDQTLTQGGTFKFFQPQRTLKIEFLKATEAPGLVSLAMVAKVNSKSWAGEEPHMWLCVKCELMPYDTGFPQRHKFNCEFQFNADSWDPTVYFEDSRTGKPPIDLLEGTGYKKIVKQKEADFEEILGVRIQGG